MKRFLLSMALLATCIGTLAQTRIPLLDKVPGHRVQCSYTYSVSKNGGAFSEVTKGNLEVEENAFRLDALGLRIVSDGTTRWTLDEDAREAVVEAVQKEDITANPALLIGHYADYDLVVNASGKDFLDVTLVLDESTRARFFLQDIVFGERKGKSDFSMDEKSLPDDYLLTDLR